MSKRVRMRIEDMPEALEALNSSIQRAVMMMSQKDVAEATASIAINIWIDPISNYPKINYKTSVRMPLEITDKGVAVKASQIEWDADIQSFVMTVDGEQVRISAEL